MKKHVIYFIIFSAFMISCASVDRGCSSCIATNYGADWVVVELTEVDGTPYRCWGLRDVSLTSEQGSDGIYWKDRSSGNLIHVSGSYDYVQVINDQWDNAFKQINMTSEACKTIHNRVFDTRLNKYVDKETK